MGNKCCCDDKMDFSDLEIDKQLFLQMLYQEPDLSKFQYFDQSTVKQLKKMWKSKVFGGHVMKAVGCSPGMPRTRQNVLRD